MIIDLTHVFDNDVPVYPGDPKASLSQTAFIDNDTYNDHKLVTQMHVGTHMDAPRHMISGGKRINELSTDSFIGSGFLINAIGKKEIGLEVIKEVELKSESIVLIYTGFDKFYREEKYFNDSSFLSVEFAKYLVEKKVKIVGLDFQGPDVDSSWPVHKILLSNDTLIIENLKNLEKLVGVKEFEIIALPMNLKSDGAPVRVIAIVYK